MLGETRIETVKAYLSSSWLRHLLARRKFRFKS
nr:MAG TPA: hypothetical protein [Caudoviricetes sp.]